MRSKYHAVKVTVEGETFDSRKEYRRWCELKLMQKAGLIKDLHRQVEYTLLPAQKDDRGKIIERTVKYKADFVYTDCEANKSVVEDAKGVRTKEYILKRKLMLYIHGIRITEV